MLLPILVPSLAIGEGLTPWFLRLGIADSLPAIVLSHLVTVLPYVTLALIGGFTTQELFEAEQAAASLWAPDRYDGWSTSRSPASADI